MVLTMFDISLPESKLHCVVRKHRGQSAYHRKTHFICSPGYVKTKGKYTSDPAALSHSCIDESQKHE